MQRGIKPPQAYQSQLQQHQQQQQQQQQQLQLQQQYGIIYEKRPSSRDHRNYSAISSPSTSGSKHRSHSAIPQPPTQQHQPPQHYQLESPSTSNSSLRYGLRSRQQQRCHSNSGSRNASPAPSQPPPLAPSRLTSGRHAMPTTSGIPTTRPALGATPVSSSGIPQPQSRRGSAAAAMPSAATSTPPSSLPQPQLQRHQRARSEQPQQPQQPPPPATKTQLPQPSKLKAASALAGSAIPAPSTSAKTRTASKKPPTPQSSTASVSLSTSSSNRRLLSRPTIGQPRDSASAAGKSAAYDAPQTSEPAANPDANAISSFTFDGSDDDPANSLQIDVSDLDEALNNADELSISSSELSDAVAEWERSVCAGGEGRAAPDLYGPTLRKASADYSTLRSSNRLQQLLASEAGSGGGSGGYNSPDYYFSDTESVQRQQQHQQQRLRSGGFGGGVGGGRGPAGYYTIRSAAGQAPASLPMSAVVPPAPNQSLHLPYPTLGGTMRSSCSTGSFHPKAGSGIGVSTLSIYSAVSSSATTANEERQAMEIAKLRSELESAQQRIASLAGQLCANTDAADAFERSLSDVTTKLRDLASSAERKDTELARLRAAVGALKREEAPMQLMMQQQQQQQQAPGESKRHHRWLKSLRGSKKQQQQQQQQQTLQAEQQLKQQSEEVDALSELELQQKQPSAAELLQLRSLTEQMRADISNLKAENCRLQQLQQLRADSLSEDHGFCGSVSDVYGGARRLSVDSTALSAVSGGEFSLDSRLDLSNGSLGFDLIDGFPGSADSLRLTVLAGDGQPIGCLPVCPRTKWETLDACCGRLFKEYLTRVDPSQGLGLGADSVVAYEIVGGGDGGRVKRSRGASTQACAPPLIACMSAANESANCRLTDVSQYRLHLQLHLASELDTLALDTLVPKPTLQRYISLLREHRRIVLCGPAGVGKSRLASRLAAHLAGSSDAASVAAFSAARRSERDLRAFLLGLNNSNPSSTAGHKDKAASVAAIVLDNLHLVDSLPEILTACLPPINSPPYYYIVGVMSQIGNGQAGTLQAAKLELHSACHFRWVQCSALMEPVRGLLGRRLRQKLAAAEVDAGARLPEMTILADWLQEAWLRLNQLLETHAGPDCAIGPGQFSACPMDNWRSAEQWFLRLWNHCLVPYIIEACREGLRLRGVRAAWEDPAVRLKADWPWSIYGGGGGLSDSDELISIRPEDVGYDQSSTSRMAVASGFQSNKTDPTFDANEAPSCSSSSTAIATTTAAATAATTATATAASSTTTTSTDDRLMAMLIRLQEVANCGLASDLTDCV